MKLILILLIGGYITISTALYMLLQLFPCQEQFGVSPTEVALLGPVMLVITLTVFLTIVLIPLFMGAMVGSAATSVAKGLGCSNSTAKTIGMATGAVVAYKMSQKS
jgi:hypothetical protein